MAESRPERQTSQRERQEEGIAEIIKLAFKELIEKIKQLLRKEKEKGLSKKQKELLSKYQRERIKRKKNFFPIIPHLRKK